MCAFYVQQLLIKKKFPHNIISVFHTSVVILFLNSIVNLFSGISLPFPHSHMRLQRPP